MTFLEGFDKKTKQVAAIMLVTNIGLLLFLMVQPLETKALLRIIIISEIISLLIALIFTCQAVKLYGLKSSEGKLWTKMLAMLIVLAIGVAVSDGQETTHRFAIFVIIGFLLMAWGIIEKIQDSGLKPAAKDVVYAGSICTSIFIFIGIIMSLLGDHGLSTIPMNEYMLEVMAVMIAFMLTFMAIMMSRLMGGHISKGWHFISMGAILFAIFYSILVPLRALGLYEDHIFIEGIAVMSINTLAFSAYYQRRMHLKLIEDMM